MDRRHSAHRADRIKQRRLRRKLGRTITSWICMASAFGLFLVVVLPQSGSDDKSLAQSAKTTSQNIVPGKQPDPANPKSADTQKLNDPSRSTATTMVVTQVAPLTFTLSPDNFTPYQGQLVRFTINPSRQTKPFPFEFDFGPGEEKASIADTFAITHRFSTSGSHPVKASVALPADQAPDVERNVPPVEINVQKLQLTVCGVPVDSNPQIFVGQEISLATQDLKDRFISYRFVLDGRRGCTPTRTETSQPASSTFVCSRSGQYTAYVELNGSDLKPPAVSERRDLHIDPLPQDFFKLSFTPEQPAINQQVTLSASVTFSEAQSACQFRQDGIQYRFWFGEGTPEPWGASPTATHTYKEATSYDPYVEIRIGNSEPIRRTVHILVGAQIIKEPPRPSVCVPCLIIGGGIILISVGLGCYFVYRLVGKPRPAAPDMSSPGAVPTTTHPHQPAPSHVIYVFDSGERTANDRGVQLSVSLEVRLNTQVSRSQSHLMLNDRSLIKSLRRHHV